MLTVRGLEVSFGPIQVLRGVDLDVQKGEIVSLLGPNGCGKSTLLRTLVGVVHAKKGSVVLENQEILRLPTRKRVSMGLTLVPQGRRLFTSMTVEENLRMGAVGRSDRDGIEAELEHWLEFFELNGLRSRIAQRLSGGQQQMVAVARGLMARPSILMFDEPSLGVAPVITARIGKIIRRLRDERGITIILVEQNVSLALSVADRVTVLAGGRIALEDKPENLEDRVRLSEVYFGSGNGKQN